MYKIYFACKTCKKFLSGDGFGSPPYICEYCGRTRVENGPRRTSMKFIKTGTEKIRWMFFFTKEVNVGYYEDRNGVVYGD